MTSARGNRIARPGSVWGTALGATAPDVVPGRRATLDTPPPRGVVTMRRAGGVNADVDLTHL